MVQSIASGHCQGKYADQVLRQSLCRDLAAAARTDHLDFGAKARQNVKQIRVLLKTVKARRAMSIVETPVIIGVSQLCLPITDRVYRCEVCKSNS